MPRRVYSRAAVIADAVGITSVIVCVAALIIGEYTDLMRFMKSDHAGVEFVYRYLCAPIYSIVGQYLPTSGVDNFYIMVVALFVIVASSLIYGLIAYFVLRFIFSLVDVKD